MDRLPITHVAIRFQGTTYSLPAPNRHHNVIWMIAETLQLSTVQAPDEDQGFLDSSGKWLSRKAAVLNAKEHNQLNDRPIIGGRLYSENLW